MAASTIWVDGLKALWCAIDQKSELNSDGETPIQTKFKFESDTDCLPGVTPAFSDLNSIAIWPTTITTEFFDHRTKQFPVAFQINIWVREWILEDALKMWMNVMDAIYLERDEGLYPNDNQKLNTYIKMATGRHARIGTAQFLRELEDGKVGGHRATRIEATVLLDTSKETYPR